VLGKQTVSLERKQWDVELISGQLMVNPEETYAAIFGEPKKRTSREWRYEGGLIVTMKGSDAGSKWYSFTEGKGGGPIKAIQEWRNLYEDGKRQEKTNKIPAALIPVRNAQGELTGVQRIYLDANTAGKNTFMDNGKLSKGITQGSAGIIQVGQKNGRLYIAEGPETCASTEKLLYELGNPLRDSGVSLLMANG
jgi:hypothetical protein